MTYIPDGSRNRTLELTLMVARRLASGERWSTLAELAAFARVSSRTVRRTIYALRRSHIDVVARLRDDSETGLLFGFKPSDYGYNIELKKLKIPKERIH